MPKLIPVPDALSQPFWTPSIKDGSSCSTALNATGCNTRRSRHARSAARRRPDVERGRGKRPYRGLHRDRGWPPQRRMPISPI